MKPAAEPIALMGAEEMSPHFWHGMVLEAGAIDHRALTLREADSLYLMGAERAYDGGKQ